MSEIEVMLERLADVFTQTFLDIEIWRIIVAGFIMIVTLAVRKVLLKVLLSVLKKLTSKTKTTIDDQLVEAVNPPGKLLFVVLGLFFVFHVLQIQVTEDNFGGHIIRTILAFAVFWMIFRAAGIITYLFEGAIKKTNTELDDMLVPFVNKGIKTIVVIVGVSVIAEEWRYDLGALLAGLGLGGLAFALAAQETLSNLFGGLTIMIDKPFAVGDWIHAPDIEGTVEDIGFRSTKVRTFAQALVTVPNSTLAKEPITNWSRMGKRRISFQLGVRYETTKKQMENLLQRLRKMLAEHPDVHPQTVFVYFDQYGPSSYDIFFYFFTKTTNWQMFLETKEDINLKIMEILEQLGVEVAFPSTSVYLENEKET